MADVINLRQARKRKERQAKEKSAEANRAKFGTPTLLRKQAKLESDRKIAQIDAHRLDHTPDTETPGKD